MRIFLHNRAAACSWTIVYDTIYACQDREDDVRAGVKSTAVLFGDRVRPILVLFTLLFLVLMTYAGVSNGQGAGYFVVACAGSAGHFVWIFCSWDVDVPEDGGAKFQVCVCAMSRLRRGSHGTRCYFADSLLLFASQTV